MIDFLYSIDKFLLLFINRSLATPVGDVLWPLITNYDKLLPVRIVLAGIWVWLVIKGGVRGRTVALMIIPVLFLCDKLSSFVIKELVARPRPCSTVDGIPVVQGLRLLVDCGPGKSFPSSHAVNNFGVATVFAFYYRRGTWAFFAWAALVALSRPAVGVHYPSDIVGGALIGTLVACAVIGAWQAVQKRFFHGWLVHSKPGDPHEALQKD